MAVIAETRPAVRPQNSLVTPQAYEDMNFLPDGVEWDKKHGLRVALIGQGQFGADALKVLKADGHEISQVYGIGGGKDALEKECILQAEGAEPENAREKSQFFDLKTELIRDNRQNLIQRIKDDGIDLIVMAFVEDYVPTPILNAAKLGPVEYHPSMLPEERGPSSIPYAIAKGREVTGMSLLRASKGMDTGPTLMQAPVRIYPSDTPFSLNDVMGKAGISFLRDGVRLITLGKDEWTEQDESKQTTDPRAVKTTAEINHNVVAKKAYDQARGFLNVGPYVKIDASSIENMDVDPRLVGDDVILNLGGVISLRDDVFPEREPAQLAEITEEGITVASVGGSIRYSEITLSKLITDKKGNVVEDKTARRPKLNGLQAMEEYKMVPGISFRLPIKEAV